METIRGRMSLDMDLTELKERASGYKHIALDLGTGDGRYVHHLAKSDPRGFMIGVDSCRENLWKYSRTKSPNTLFVIASAQNLPCELNGLVSHLTINFPWGSLLAGLLGDDTCIIRGLLAILRPGACVDVRLNGGALEEAGWPLEGGTDQICANLLRAGWVVEASQPIGVDALRSFPSTWARRLAFGRDPHGIGIQARLCRK